MGCQCLPSLPEKSGRKRDDSRRGRLCHQWWREPLKAHQRAHSPVIARAAAVRYGDRLTPDAMEALVADLFRSKEANYTPDGKKIICTVTFDDINKMFS